MYVVTVSLLMCSVDVCDTPCLHERLELSLVLDHPALILYKLTDIHGLRLPTEAKTTHEKLLHIY